MGKHSISNSGSENDSGLYVGAEVDFEGTGTHDQIKVDSDGDGKIDDLTNDNRGFGPGAYFVLGNRWQKDKAKFGFDLSGALGASYLWDWDGSQYMVVATHDSGLAGTSSTPTDDCGASNCADHETQFPGVSLSVRPMGTYSFNENNRLMFGATLGVAYYPHITDAEGNTWGAYVPSTVVVDGETLPSDGADPFHLALRGGLRGAYQFDAGTYTSVAVFAQFTDGFGFLGSADESLRNKFDWQGAVGITITGRTSRDPDHDGLKDKYENLYGTSPRDADFDDDGLPDGIEDANHNGTKDADETNAKDDDTDDDLLKDGIEDADLDGTRAPTETDPRFADSDGDGLSDGIEDANRNGELDEGETNPTNPDTDGDGLKDGVEDANHDGVKGADETDPRVADTDGDGLNDGVEDVNLDGIKDEIETDPREADTDGDGLNDGLEVRTGTNPLLADSDVDGLSDGDEDADRDGSIGDTESNPREADTDGDGLNDGVEVLKAKTNPLLEDSDVDGIKDPIENPEAVGKKIEELAETKLTDTDTDGKVDAASPDDDGDGVPTAQEVVDGQKAGDDGKIPGNDVDGDGKPNHLDANADNDGIARDGDEAEDVFPKNGVADYLEVMPKDSDGDGLADDLESIIGSNLKKADSDGDGLSDKVEYDDSLALSPGPEVKSPDDVDGDGKKNWLDNDSDGDTLLDNEAPKGEGRVDNDGDGKPAYVDRSNVKIVIQGSELKFDGAINYKKNSAEINMKDAHTVEILFSLMSFLKDHPEITKVSIEGFTSTEGSTAHNLDLSKRRAASVKSFLIKQGVSKDILVSVGHGEDPAFLKIDPEVTEDDRAQNRRTEFHITLKQPDVRIEREETE